MPRTIQLSVPAACTGDLLADVDGLDLLSLHVHHGVSVRPPGDLIVLEVANEKLGAVMRLADRYGLGQEGGIAMSTSEPLSVISTSAETRIREPGATTWEELELSMGAESTMTAEKVTVMGIAGIIAGIGILSDSIHVVVGAMVIAPGFQPFSRLVLGLVNRRRDTWMGGTIDIARAYGALVAGSAVAAVLGLVLGASPLDAGLPSYLESGSLVVYWTTLTWPGVAVGGVAGVCGGLLMSINRTVLTAGVMVALALVPSAAMVTMALVAGDPALALAALVRFLVEAALVLAGSTLVFAVKRRMDRRRSAE